MVAPSSTATSTGCSCLMESLRMETLGRFLGIRFHTLIPAIVENMPERLRDYLHRADCHQAAQFNRPQWRNPPTSAANVLNRTPALEVSPPPGLPRSAPTSAVGRRPKSGSLSANRSESTECTHRKSSACHATYLTVNALHARQCPGRGASVIFDLRTRFSPNKRILHHASRANRLGWMCLA